MADDNDDDNGDEELPSLDEIMANAARKYGEKAKEYGGRTRRSARGSPYRGSGAAASQQENLGAEGIIGIILVFVLIFLNLGVFGLDTLRGGGKWWGFFIVVGYFLFTGLIHHGR